jgi:hypothetical protein
VEKPIDGKYTLTLSQPTFGPYEVSILTYDQQGNPTFLNQSGWIGPTPTTFELHYADQGTSTISRISSFGQFRQQLLMLRKNAQVAKYESWHRLDRLAEFGMTGSLQTRTRLKQVLASNILNNPSLTTGAQQLLMAELNAL